MAETMRRRLTLQRLEPRHLLAGDSTVVFNELMYHPTGGDQDLEWVELHNQMAVDMDLSGWRLGEAVEFEFPQGTRLSGGDYLVVAAAPEKLLAETGFDGAMGPYTGRLSNGGEEVVLYSNNQRRMDSVDYRDRGDWPVPPDGSGVTLAKLDPDTGSGQPENWAASAQLGGTPGAANFPTLPQAATVNLWSVDLEGTAGGAHGNPPVTADGVEPVYGFGDVWNSLLVTSHPGTVTDPAMDLVDYHGTDTPVRFSVDGRVSAWNNAPAEALRGDYLFINAGNAGANITWQITGLPPDESFEMYVYGNPAGNRHFNMAVDLDGDGGLADEISATVGSGGRLFSTITSDTAGRIIGNMTNAGVEGNWTGFQLREIRIEQPGGPETTEVVFNEIAAAGDPQFQLELHNPGTEPVELTGSVIAATGGTGGQYVLPQTTLPAGGYLAIDRATLGFAPQDGDRLFLYDARRTMVLDGVHVDDELQGRSAGHDGRWLSPSQPTFGGPNLFAFQDAVVINEIMYHAYPQRGETFAESPEEWIELYNRSEGPVDLSGWELDGAVEYAFPAGTSIAAGEYLVVARDRAAMAVEYPAIDVLGDYSGRLSNGGELVVLVDPEGNPADEVRYYDDGRWPEQADGGGSSLELRDPRSDNSKAEAWAASDETGKTAWQTYTYRGTAVEDGIGYNIWHEFVMGLLNDGELLIDDISVLEDPDGAAVEMVQNGSFQADAIGSPPGAWRLIGNHGGHGQSVVVADPDEAANRVLKLVATGATEHEHNHAETTFGGGLRVAAGRQYQISYRARWLSGSNQLNTRLYFNWLQATTLIDVPSHGGTPGGPNSQLKANAGPTYDAFGHAPVVPDAGQPTTVSATAEDPDGVAAMTLHYSVNGGGFNNVSMSDSGDGRYEGTIPGQAGGRVVQFYVSATDSLGVTSTYPTAGPDSRAMYAVADGRGSPGRLHNLRVVMTPADRDFLYLSTNRLSNHRLGGTLIYDQRIVHYDVGVRLKGSPWGRTHDSIVSLNVKFAPDDLFRGVHEAVALSRRPKKEIVAKHLFNSAGGGLDSSFDDVAYAVMPRSNNDGVALLSMARHTDQFFDSQYADGSRGTLYNFELLYTPTTTVGGNPQGLKLNHPYTHTNGSVDLRDYGDDKEAYRWNFQLRNGRGRDDYSLLMAMAKALDLSGAELDAAVADVMDVDQWMRTFAMESLAGNDDFYTRIWNHNFQMFQRPEDNRMVALPWDLDRAFQLSTSASLWGGGRIQKVITRPANRRLYYGHLWDIIQTTYNTAYMAHWTSHYGGLTGESYAGILSYIGSRANYVRGQLPAAVPLRITTNGGNDFSVDDPTAVIQGDGWIDVRQLRLAGTAEPLEVTWIDADTWQIVVPLQLGPNLVQLEAYDHRGNRVGSDALTVTSTYSGARLRESLRITEINYNPYAPTAEEIAAGLSDANAFEFIELENIGHQPLDMLGVHFDDGIEFHFTGTPGGSSVLLTEAGTGLFDYAEIQNVSDSPVDTTGWTVLANNANDNAGQPDINAWHAATWQLPQTIGPGEVLYRTDDPADAENYWGQDVFWRTGGLGWVMLVDDLGGVADFVAWGYGPDEIASLRLEVGQFVLTAEGAWNGDAVPAEGLFDNSLQRSGELDHDHASDWAFVRPQSKGLPNPELLTPFAGESWLQPGEFVVVAGDLRAFRARYGSAVPVVGPFDRNLSNGGEQITLRDRHGLTILSFDYDDEPPLWPGRADGKGASLELIDPAAVPPDEPGRFAYLSDPGSWLSSGEYGGSPGYRGAGLLGDVVVNEVLSHTGPPTKDAIELHNTTGADIDVGGWYLSDSWGWEWDATNGDYKKFRIPQGTVIPAGGYAVFDEDDFNPSGGVDPQLHPRDFELPGAAAGDVWLMEADAQGKLTRFVDHVEFAAAAQRESWGRWPNGTGLLYPMSYPTLDKQRPGDGQNSGPRVGPVVFGQVHYNPDPGLVDDDLEFVEIYNPTCRAVDLTDWRIRGGVDYDFLPGTVLGPMEPLVIVPFSLARADLWSTFCAQYGLDPAWTAGFLGGYTGQLSDTGERVQLQRPDTGPDNPPGFISRLLEDEVTYDDQPPWPGEAAGGGGSLHRTAADAWGNSDAGWAAAPPTPGTTTFQPRCTEILGRYVFYNGSAFDGGDAAADSRDDDAMAPDKQALLPGGTATKANYTSFSGGLSGIMIDLQDLSGTPGVDDFRFHAGNDDHPGNWPPAPDPGSVTVRRGEGTDGSDRVTLVWHEGAVQKQWLKVTVLATAETGLPEEDVFYFGNAIGETGNSASDAKVGAVDMLGARDNQRNFLNPAPIDFAFDFDRDARVNSVDMLIARNNQTHFLNALNLITVPGGKAVGEQAAESGRAAAPDAVPGGAVWGKLDWLLQLEPSAARRRDWSRPAPGLGGAIPRPVSDRS